MRRTVYLNQTLNFVTNFVYAQAYTGQTSLISNWSRTKKMTRFAKCENENTFSRVLHNNKARVRKSGLCSRAFAPFGSLFLTKQVSGKLSMFLGLQTKISQYLKSYSSVNYISLSASSLENNWRKINFYSSKQKETHLKQLISFHFYA